MVEQKILKGQIDFPDFMSEEARASIRAMLQPEPSNRPVAKDILKLEFFIKNTPAETPQENVARALNMKDVDFKKLYE